MIKHETCHTCRGRCDVPTGAAAGFNSAHAVWTKCHTCEGFGVVEAGEYGCDDCLDSGVNVYDLDFDPANPQPCRSCHPAPEPDPTPAPAGTVVVAGHEVYAPGFTAASFDRAIARAHNEGIYLEATDRRDLVLAVNPTNGTAYTVSRTSCTCTAGTRGTACKHVAMAVFMADVMHDLPVARMEVA